MDIALKVDEIADDLDDAAERFRSVSRKLIEDLQAAKDAYDDEIHAATDWACMVGLIEDPAWTDEIGEPFLPSVRLEVLREPVADVATMFRERVATLCSSGVVREEE